jgi:hypothetical protein
MQLPQHSSIEHNLSKLPLVRCFLVKYVESITEYQLRRVCVAVKILSSDFQPLHLWRVFRLAGLSKERITPDAARILKLSGFFNTHDGKINHFDHNVTVTHIGGLFKGSKSKIWSINLQCSPKQEKKFTNFSNAAMLIRGKKLNCSERQLSKPNLVITLSDQNFLTSLLKDFDELSTDSNLTYFEGIQTSFIIEGPNQVTIHLPQFELARTLFLINSYFCRASLSTTTIQNEFAICQDNEETVIVFLENTMPLKLVNQKGTQCLLAWLLLDPNAKQSFESICRYFNTQLIDKDGWKKWIFQFDPPSMDGWTLHFRGRYNRSQDAFLVEEIVGIEIDTDIPTDISFDHPSFTQIKTEGQQSEQGYKPEYSSTLDPTIEDGTTASIEHGVRILDGNESWVSFKKPLTINKKGKPK